MKNAGRDGLVTDPGDPGSFPSSATCVLQITYGQIMSPHWFQGATCGAGY